MNTLVNPSQFRSAVTSGSTIKQTTLEKTPFSKEPANVTSASSQENYETFTASQAPAEDVSARLRAASVAVSAPAASGFSALSTRDQTDAKKIVKDLSQKARLFARDEEGALVRISPGYAKERLDRGEPVEVVTQIGQETSHSSSSYRSDSLDVGFFSNDSWGRNSSSESSEVKATYTSSPLSSWEGLLWHDDEADVKGIPGVAKLPPSGSTVTTSKSWEKSWGSYSEMHSGFFGKDVDIRESSRFEKALQTPQ